MVMEILSPQISGCFAGIFRSKNSSDVESCRGRWAHRDDDVVSSVQAQGVGADQGGGLGLHGSFR